MISLYNVLFAIYLTNTIKAMVPNNRSLFIYEQSEPESEIADLIFSKGYLPNEKDLPKSTVLKKNENDETYILSKLSDNDIIKLLSDQTMKTDFEVKDIIKVTMDRTSSKNNLILPREARLPYQSDSETEYNKMKKNIKPTNLTAYFRLEKKEVVPQLQNEAEFMAFKKLNNLLHSVTQPELKKENIVMDDATKEILFDVLVTQLKSLCCKKSIQQETLSDNIMYKSTYKSPNNIKQKTYQSKYKLPLPTMEHKTNEFMFLIINDEIKSKGSGELISVDPESLEKNSSVLLLGPITTQLSDAQLLSIMNLISYELSKPEYVTLLQQLSDGTLSDNKNLLNNFIYGSETRRYIKPHRCNHQSKLAKVYGGPKWLICTGYININTPSLYD